MGNFFELFLTPLVHIQNDQCVMGVILRYLSWGTHRPPPGGPAADRPTRRPLRFGSTKGGGRAPSPPSEGETGPEHGCFSSTPHSRGSATHKQQRYGSNGHKHSYRRGCGTLHKECCRTN